MLEGRVVVDCSDRSGWLAGRILADLGAEVIKVDAPSTDRLDADWQAFNVNKRTVDADLATEEGRARLDSLVDGAARVDRTAQRPRRGCQALELIADFRTVERHVPSYPAAVATRADLVRRGALRLQVR